MSPLLEVIIKKKTNINPIWIMRQAGRYLPEFREIRKKNQDFIRLCLNPELSSEITIQPLKRFEFDAAIIFSDILMVPYGLNQEVVFKKLIGPELGELNIDKALNFKEEDFKTNLQNVYKAINLVSSNTILNNKSLIGFVGAPWTLLVYMLNQKSPKNNLKENFYNNKELIENILNILDKFLKIHIENQVKNGAKIIQIFDSWAGLLNDSDLEYYVYQPTISLVEFTKKLNVPVICFPRNIHNYKKFCETVKPDVISIDYNVDPKKILKEVNIPIQGGMDPKILLSNRDNLKKEALKYLSVFKDHPYIFNLGHGIQPETKIEMVEELVNTVKDFK